jgi:hypothetical protein
MAPRPPFPQTIPEIPAGKVGEGARIPRLGTLWIDRRQRMRGICQKGARRNSNK